MKILHICLCGPMTDGFTYQENLLTKYHKKMGHDVYVITSCWYYNDYGEIEKTFPSEYVNRDNVKIIRLDCKQKFSSKFKVFKKLYDNIENINPDILFIHGVQFVDIKVIVKYLKHHNIKVFADNHNDYLNSATNFLSKWILHKIIWKYYSNLLIPYVKKFYGVLPSRVDFLNELYKIPKEKCELLIMGADDEYVDKYVDTKKIRKEFNISDKTFVLVTGGKIDKNKLETLTLMKIVKDFNLDVKLFIFGSIASELKTEFLDLCDNDKVNYLGWADQDSSYKYFAMADLVIFPGRHSVYWEQVVAQGKPIICKNLHGYNHIDIGGNVVFVNNKNLSEVLLNIIQNKKIFETIKKASLGENRKKFLYSKIAEDSIK